MNSFDLNRDCFLHARPMSITDLTLKDINEIKKLLEKKQNLQSQIEEINAQLLGIGQGTAPKAKAAKRTSAKKTVAAPKRTGGKRGPRGQVKEKIIEQLEDLEDIVDGIATLQEILEETDAVVDAEEVFGKLGF